MGGIRSARTLFASSVLLTVLAGAGSALRGACGPFTDVALDNFCPFVLEIFYFGITTGTTPTTFDPTANVSRLQMAAFLSRTVDGTVKRGSRRAALRQFWTTQGEINLGVTTLPNSSGFVESDGLDLWVGTNFGDVFRVKGSDGRILETWTGAQGNVAVVPAMGKIFVDAQTDPSKLYRIDPSQPAGAVTTVASNLAAGAAGMAFDGGRIWIANVSGSVSIVTPGLAIPWTSTTVATGFSGPTGIVYDGASIWVSDTVGGKLLKLDSFGAILQTVTLGGNPILPVFDGTNLWVPNFTSNSVAVVRLSTGTILTTLTGNGLNGPAYASFDGQRVLVTNQLGDSVSLWKAADLTVIRSVGTGVGSAPQGACSDGTSFWIVLGNPNRLARF
jgi:DNA-binding beta-propeller fold protein YncE